MNDISLVHAFLQAFFAKDYISNHPEDGDKITRLRELMFEQVETTIQNNATVYFLLLICYNTL